MIKDIEEESKTKFSMEVEFSFSFKAKIMDYQIHIAFFSPVCYSHFTDIGGVLAAVSSLPKGISFSAGSVSEYIPDDE